MLTVGAQEAETEADATAIWAALRDVAWCPVWASPPDPDLPWQHAAPSSTSALFVAPRMVRPASDAWLASAPCRLLEGPQPGAALAQRLGWAGPVAAPVAVQQLMELGALYPAGKVCATVKACIVEPLPALWGKEFCGTS